MIFNNAMFSKISFIRRGTPISVTRKLLWWAITVLPFLWSQLAFGSTLSNLANSMQAGTWAQFTTNSIQAMLASETGASGILLNYAMTGNWNPNEGKAYFFGADHHGGLPGYGARLVWYDEASNTWLRSAVQPAGTAEPSTLLDPWTGGPDPVHGYDLWSIDVANQFMYWNSYDNNTGTITMSRSPMPVGPDTFVSLTPAFTAAQYDAGYVGSEYWPGKGFVVFDCNSAGGQVIIRNDSDGSYISLTDNFTTAPYHCAAVYSPTYNVMIFGGGNNNTQEDSRIVWKLNSDNTYTRLTDTPFSDGWGIQKYNAALDPVSGNFLFEGNGELWELNPTGSGSWTQKTGAAVPPSGVLNPVGGANGVISIPISNYGVVMYVSCLVGNCSVFLYKNAAGTSSPPSTLAPTVNISANPTSIASGGASTLSWTSANATSCTASNGWSGTKAVSGSQSMGNLTANTSYTLTCTGTGGSASQTVTVGITSQASTPPPSSVATDFQTRCSAAGVVRCFGFDTNADLGPAAFGANFGNFNNSGVCNSSATVLCPVVDTSISASGGGSMKFTIPSQSGAGASGQWYANFSSDLSTRFGQNSDFYIQWRQRFSTEFLNTVYQGGGGWKQMITGMGDNPGCSTSYSANCTVSCTGADVVTQNTYQRGFAQAYQSCSQQGGLGHIPYWPFEDTTIIPGDIDLQDGMPSPYCLYSKLGSSTNNCFYYFPNEWMTFQLHVSTGPLVDDQSGSGMKVYQNSHVDLWVAREGQPSQQVLNFGPFNINADIGEQYGKVWLLPYHTGKDPTQVHPTGYTWYDELIISTSKIADPGYTAPATPPLAPTNLILQ
jgi:hypothetical protein